MQVGDSGERHKLGSASSVSRFEWIKIGPLEEEGERHEAAAVQKHDDRKTHLIQTGCEVRRKTIEEKTQLQDEKEGEMG